MNCPYCKNKVILTTGESVYPFRPGLKDLSIYKCSNCDARVGCHKGTTKPLGTVADEGLRKLRSKVHQALDPMWKYGGMSRSEAYEMLSSGMGIDKKDCHIGFFREEDCIIALEVIRCG